jgi:hypothetical protein
MSGYGYSTLTDRAFVGFLSELSSGAWAKIDTSKFEHLGDHGAASLLDAPHTVVWKLRLTWGIQGVMSALGNKPVGELDDAWDATQRRLFHKIAAAADAPESAQRDAADRLTAVLLLGNGTAQTALDYDAEVDFGRKQVALARSNQSIAADVKELGLEPTLAQIEQATEALAGGIGRQTGGKRATPSRRLRSALFDCAATFSGVRDAIEWFLSRTHPGTQHDQLEALLAPLVTLASRGSPTAHTQPPTPAPAPAQPTAATTGK